MKVFKIFWSKVQQNAISDFRRKFQLILMSTFGDFHSKSLESYLGCKINFWPTSIQTLKSFKVFAIFW